jgi:16S rRNA (cytosine967-C5)-methyltransferase
VKSNVAQLRSKVSPARAAAFDILLRVERDGAYASELLHARTYERLSTVDHALTTELVMGVLRWRSVLDEQIATFSDRPVSKFDLEVLTAIRLGVYQIGWLSRVPSHAAIDESVELVKRARKRSAAAFVNAVLRKLVAAKRDRGISGFGETVELAISAHPPWLVERWMKTYGLETAREICRYDQSVPPTVIRFRQSSTDFVAGVERRLGAEGIELASGALMAAARRVVRGDITHCAAFREGLFFIQDEASQLVAALVGKGKRILDCCAAPGGKTRLIADRNQDAEIVAADLHEHRARLLKRLLAGAAADRQSRHHVVAADAQSLPLAVKFDRILADVPCSGTGTLARNPEIKRRLGPEDLVDLQSRQMAILKSVMKQLADGGRIVYSTCSLEREENEVVIECVLAEYQSFRLIDCRSELDRLTREGQLIWSNPESLTRGPYLRTLPGVHPCDGFFAAILEKR